MHALRRLWRRLFDRDTLDHELSEEMRFHIERQTQENIAAGMPPDAADVAARKAFGSVAAIEEESRVTGGWPVLETVVTDVRHAIRLIGRNPSFAASVIATLAMAIAACATMFSVVDAVLLRPIGLPEPERLFALFEGQQADPTARGTLSPPNFLDVREQNRDFASMAAYYSSRYNLTGHDTEAVEAVDATADLFRALGVAPRWGRGFVASDTAAGDVVVLGYGLATRQFGSAAAAVNQPIILDGKRVMVAGIMAPTFHFPLDETEIWKLVTFAGNVGSQRGAHYLRAIARLAPGIAPAAGARELDVIGQRLAAAYPGTNAGTTMRIVRHDEALVADVRHGLLILLGAVAVLALIACANVANLLLVRATGRSRELAMRGMLGATRGRVIRQLVTESAVLALVAGGAGLVLTWIALRLLTVFGPAGIPRLNGAHLDGRVLMATFVAALLATLLFSIPPALSATRPLRTAAVHGGRVLGHRRAGWTRMAMAAFQLTLAVTLLAGAALLVRSFLLVTAVDLGFDPHDVVTFRVSMPASYDSTARLNVFYDDALARLRAIPGVAAAGTVSRLPVAGGSFSSDFRINGVENPAWDGEVYVADEGFFNVLRIPLVRGRGFDGREGPGTQRVVLVNESGARKFWPSGNAIGAQMRFGASDGFERYQGEIIGVVRDVRYRGQEKEIPPTFYVPLRQSGDSSVTFVLRSRAPLPTLLPAVKGGIAAASPGVAVAKASTMDTHIADSLSRRRFQVMLLTFFAAAALLLASLGVYGVMAHSVGQRTQEIGVRVAVGANLMLIFRMVIGEALRIVAPAVVAGLAIAIALHRLIAALLFGVSATDTATLSAVAVTVTVVSLVAASIPARRAARLDPIVALRAE
jgi:putative ABC transport system permease protein